MSSSRAKTAQNPRAALFDRLAPAWDSMPALPDAAARLSRVARAGRTRAGDRVLDVGTGTGTLIPFILPFSPALIAAVDLSYNMLRLLHDKHSVNGILQIVGDALRLPLPRECVDVIYCNAVWPHLDGRAAAAEFARVSRPGGRLVISHIVGRERVNSIHASSEDEVLHCDLLAPAAELLVLLADAGWTVQDLEDSDIYLIVANRAALWSR